MIDFEQKLSQRGKRLQALKKGPIALIDIGSYSICIFIAHYMPVENPNEPPSFRILASKYNISKGVSYGEIVNLAEVEGEILRALQVLQRQAQVRTDYAAICFSGGHCKSLRVLGQSKIEQGEVTEDDIAQCLGNCDFPDLGPNRDLLHALPISFTLDHRHGLPDPRGQIGARLEVEVHAIAVDKSSLEVIKTLVKRAEMELIAITNTAYMSGLAVLPEDAQNLGAIVIDFGAMTTSIGIFGKKELVYVQTLLMGGHHVTSDIAHAFKIPFDEAERLKTMHGGIYATAADDLYDIKISDPSGHGSNYITRAELMGVIRPRMEEIFETIAQEFFDIGIDNIDEPSIVVTGGASHLTGLNDIAERYLGRWVTMGRNIHLAGASQEQVLPNNSALSGLALYIAKPNDELWDFESAIPDKRSLSLRAIWQWLKKSW